MHIFHCDLFWIHSCHFSASTPTHILNCSLILVLTEKRIWKVGNKELSGHEIRVSIKEGLPSSMQDDLEDNQEDHCSLTHEFLCDLLSIIKVKDKRERAATQIKRIETSRVASHSDSNESIRVPCKKRDRTGVIPNRKQQGENIPNHHGAQCHCILCRKSGIYERKYMLHGYEDCFGKALQPKFHQGWTGRSPRQ